MFLCTEADKKKNLYAFKLESGAWNCEGKKKSQLPYLQHFYFSYIDTTLLIFLKHSRFLVNILLNQEVEPHGHRLKHAF